MNVTLAAPRRQWSEIGFVLSKHGTCSFCFRLPQEPICHASHYETNPFPHDFHGLMLRPQHFGSQCAAAGGLL
jgi:hypothetical protein